MKHLVESLSTKGYYIRDNFISSQQVHNLRQCIVHQWKEACIGNGSEVKRLSTIRRDKIQWLKRDMGDAVASYLDKMEAIRELLNRHCFLGLAKYDAHFAKYEKGDFYKKHLDSFQTHNDRRLTSLFYMNDHWSKQDAGELVMYDLNDNKIAELPPKAGRLILFLSEQFPHEVKPTNVDRYSIAGWYHANRVL